MQQGISMGGNKQDIAFVLSPKESHRGEDMRVISLPLPRKSLSFNSLKTSLFAFFCLSIHAVSSAFRYACMPCLVRKSSMSIIISYQIAQVPSALHPPSPSALNDLSCSFVSCSQGRPRRAITLRQLELQFGSEDLELTLVSIYVAP